jgi:hypothetical protein
MNLLDDNFFVGRFSVIFMQTTDERSDRQKTVGKGKHKQRNRRKKQGRGRKLEFHVTKV